MTVAPLGSRKLPLNHAGPEGNVVLATVQAVPSQCTMAPSALTAHALAGEIAATSAMPSLSGTVTWLQLVPL
jgi:hypothetical protein